MDVLNKKWSEDYFLRERKAVLAMWPTGNDVDLDDAVAYHKHMPPSKNAALKVLEARERGVTYFCPSSGTDTIDGHKELLLYLQNVGKVDLLTTYIDSFTRNCRFVEAEQGLKKALETHNAVLNGFPVAVHGVKVNREVMGALALPVLLFGPTPDVRLTHEIGLAGGHTGYSGGPLISFWNYTKNVPVETVIHNFQYVHRLMGYYEEKGVPILYCVSGAMPSISPPSLMIAPEIIEILIAAEQGVKHIQLNNWLQGNIMQDIAYILTFKKLAQEYLERFGYRDVETTTYSVSPTGRFPAEHEQVLALIGYYTMIGLLGHVQVIGSRTIDEAHHIPTKEGTAMSFKCAQMMAGMLQAQRLDILANEAVKVESRMMEKEVRAILERVIEIGAGDIVVGTKRAIETGELDQPYATTQLVKGKVMGVKDSEGAARFFDFGQLPFDREIREYHQEKIEEREKQRGKHVGYETIINDMMAISNGVIVK
jgi:methylaspartate mutase epsilon subunit